MDIVVTVLGGNIMWVDFPIAGSFNVQISPEIDVQQTINWYAVLDNEGKKQAALVKFPGLKNILTFDGSNSPIRALFVFGGFLYAVEGANVYKLDTNFTTTLLGTIGTTTGLVSIDANNGSPNQIIFVDGNAGYIYDTGTGVFGQITGAGFPGQPLMVVFFNGYFIIPQGQSRSFFISALNDGTQWNALDFAVTQSRPGPLIGIGLVHQRLYLFKSDSVEVWYNSGSADFPFRRDNNMSFDFGCAATGSIAADFGYMFWIGADKSGPSSVMMVQGNGMPEVISTPAIDNVLHQLTTVSDCRSYIYKNEDGKLFYIVNFTTDDLTIVYNITHPQWFNLEVQVSSTVTNLAATKKRHYGDCHAFFNNTHYVGAYQGPILYGISFAYPDNDGLPIKCVRTLPYLYDQSYKSLQLKQFRAQFQTGIGNLTGAWTVPKAYLSISRDGGQTFGNQHPAPLGTIGQRGTRTVWRRLGLSLPDRSIVFRITVYDDVSPVVLTGAALEYEVLKQ